MLNVFDLMIVLILWNCTIIYPIFKVDGDTVNLINRLITYYVKVSFFDIYKLIMSIRIFNSIKDFLICGTILVLRSAVNKNNLKIQR